MPTPGGDRYEPRPALPVVRRPAPARRASVVEKARQPAVLDERGPPRGRPLAVERSAGRPVGNGSVVGEHDGEVRHLVALSAREQRAAPLNCVRGQHGADEAEEGGRHEGVEHHRAAAARRLAGAHQRDGPLGRLGADLLGVEGLGVASQPDAHAGHQVRALAGEGGRVGPGLGGLIGGGEAARVHERHRTLSVRIDGVLHLRHPGVGPSRALDGQSELDLALGAPVSQRGRGQAIYRRGAELRGQSLVIVLVGHLGGRGGSPGHLRNPLGGQVRSVGVARARAREGTNAHPAPSRIRQALDLAAVDPDSPAGGLLGPRLGVAGSRAQRLVHRAPGHLVEGHDAVPPTVSSRSSTWGCPTPAATVWPPFPQ